MPRLQMQFSGLRGLPLALLLAGCDSVSLTEPVAEQVFIDLAVGANHSCAVVPSGAIYCWGVGSRGKARE